MRRDHKEGRRIMVTAELTEQYKLTDVDIELIKHLGLPNKAICLRFHLTTYNVGVLIARLATRLGVENRTAIVIKALNLGLVTVDELRYRKVL